MIFLNDYVSNDDVKEKEIVLSMLVMTSCNMVIAANVFWQLEGLYHVLYNFFTLISGRCNIV